MEDSQDRLIVRNASQLLLVYEQRDIRDGRRVLYGHTIREGDI